MLKPNDRYFLAAFTEGERCARKKEGKKEGDRPVLPFFSASVFACSLFDAYIHLYIRKKIAWHLFLYRENILSQLDKEDQLLKMMRAIHAI